MPYIKQEDRDLYEREVQQLVNKVVDTFATEPTKISRQRAGHLNYIITSLVKRTYEQLNSRLGGLPLSYSDYNEIIGMLTSCQQEYYRKQVAAYEELKEKENGPV